MEVRCERAASQWRAALLRTAEPALGLRAVAGRPRLPGRPVGGRQVPGPGRVYAGTRRRPLAMQPFAAPRRAVRRWTYARRTVLARESLPSASQPARHPR